MERTITNNPNPTNMWASAEKLATDWQKKAEEMMALYCDGCGQLKAHCKCAEIAARKAYEEKMRPVWEAERKKREHEMFVANESKRLGGLRAFEDFTAEKYTNKAVLDALKNFPDENYYLWGKAGAGKTHAAVAILRNNPDAVVIRMGQISREVRSCETPEDEESTIEKYAKAIILLDDLGSEKATEFLQNVLFEIMDRRWQNKRGGLIITANMSIDKLGGIIGDRTASRIAGLVGSKNTLELSGKDYRIGA